MLGLRVALLAVLLAACTVPTGSEVEVCDGSWREVDSRIITPGGAEARAVPIDCMRRIDDRRIRIGLLMPAGPDCYLLSAIDVVEGSDAVSITLVAARDDNPLAGACPEERLRTTTEVDLAAPVADRTLLDGSQ